MLKTRFLNKKEKRLATCHFIKRTDFFFMSLILYLSSLCPMREAFLKFLEHLDEDLDPTISTENIEERRNRLKDVFSGFLSDLDRPELKTSTMSLTPHIRGTSENSRTLKEQSTTTENIPEATINFVSII